METAGETGTECEYVANNEILGAKDAFSSGQDELPSSSHQSNQVLFIGPLANPALAVETRYVPRDVKDPMAVNGSCGLYNLGNTCFMNSGIQSLASCAPLLKYFFEGFQLTDNLHGTLTGAFYLLLCKMWSGKYSLVQPRHFKDLLGLYHPQFQDYRQHDCQEFLALLLDTLHEQLNQMTSDSSHTPPAPPPRIAPITGDTQSHLNNEDLSEPASSGKPDKGECAESAAVEASCKLLCPETLSSEEELGGASSVVAVSPRSSQGQSSLSTEPGQVRSSLKRVSSSPAEAVMASLISEDSNHSTVSAHSTDSEQSSAFKKLKIESGSSSPGSVSVLSSVSELCDQEPAGAESQVPVVPSSGVPKEKPHTDNNNSAESGVESMEMSPPTSSGIAQRKCVRLDIPSQNPTVRGAEAFTRPNRESLAGPEPKLSKQNQESVETSGSVAMRGEVEDSSTKSSCKKFNNTEPAVSAPSENLTAPHAAHHYQKDLPSMTSSPQASAQTNPLHFYCKETKTLNTNVLVSNYVQGDVAMDSEKFAKVDNRSQVPVTKEVNLLQDALQGLEEDKVEKALIGKTLGTGTSTNLNSPASSDDKASHHSSNLRTVKTRNPAGILCKPVADPNLLNNSYDFEDEVLVGYSSLMGTSLQKTGSGGLECVKRDLDVVVGGVAEKMELGTEIPVDKVSSEVEKNVQMQALSKLKNTLTKSNIREDISDKASTSESTETEDGDMEVEAEESSASEDEKEEEEEEPISRGNVGGDNSVSLPNPARCFTAADVTAANAAWECYKARNNSIVVDTFQGQFKSTVVCSECDHVSVTYEPFMYLSLPIPYAMERQICVVYVRPHKSTVRYMLTMHKNDKVQQLRKELQSITSTENSDVILAEVLDNHVSRVLDDNIMLRYVNDTNRTIHAFQMLPPPEMPPEQVLPTEDASFPSPGCDIPSPDPASLTVPEPASLVTQPLTIDISGGEPVPERPSSPMLSVDQVITVLDPENRNSGTRSPSNSKASTDLKDPESRCEGNGVESTQVGAESTQVGAESTQVEDSGDSRSKFAIEDEDFQQLPPPERADPMLMGTGMWEWNSRDDFLNDPPPHVSAPPTSPTSEHSGTFPPTDLNLNVDYSSEALFPQSPSSMDVEMDHIPSTSDLTSSHLWSGGEEVGGKGGGDAGGETSGVIDQWQTCAICLEELMDSHLLTHQACNGVFCHTCLEMSAKHSGDLANCCPICLCPVDVSQDFVPLASSSTVKSKVRILAIPVTFRQGTVSSPGKAEVTGNEGEMRLVCGPRLTYLASQQDASALYTVVDRIVPFVETYTLHFTDGQGLQCSRCEYSVHCTGCEVAREGEVALQPGDNLTVHFKEKLPTEELEAKTHVSDDESLQRLRSSDPISIYDCFEAFTQSEVLDEHNPWFCPCCERNQCAKKTMTVWRYPDNLIIHLKRFVYEDLSSTKIDNRVVFPHTSLDVTRFLAGPTTSFNIYDLYSIVCHYGGANSGHYTAFSCHPMTSEWYYYNDETVTQQRPVESEFDSGYILFFKRQGPQLEFDLVKEPPQIEEEEANNDYTSSSTTVAPYHSPPPSPEEPSTTAVVTFETEGFSIVSDNAGTSEMENKPSYDFYN